jgi:SAM-dependent methyltransferase
MNEAVKRMGQRSSISETIEDLIREHYADVPTGWRMLEKLIRAAINAKRFPILDAGCGQEALWVQRFGAGGGLIGIDLCPQLPSGLPVVSGDLSSLPFPEGCFSLIFSRSVFEHLREPARVLSEFHRVLKPGGLCAILTPNRYDYSSLAARWTPHWFHRRFVRQLYGADAYDTFPTYYRANTPRYFQKFVSQHGGWRTVRLKGLRHYPVNLAFSKALFRLGIAYDKLIDSMKWQALQPSLLIVLKKAKAPRLAGTRERGQVWSSRIAASS